MASPLSRRDPSSAAPARATRKETAGSLLRFMLGVVLIAWAFRSFIVAAVQHPLGIDAADALHRRLSRRRQMALRLFALQLSLRLSAVQRPRLGSLPKRGDVVVFRHPDENADLIKRVIGLPGDTVEVRGGPADPQRPPGPARPLARRGRGQRQQPVPGRAAGEPIVLRATADRTASILLPRNAPRRPELHRPQPGGWTALPTISRRCGCPPARLPDGRQSRRQPRQPLPASKAGSAWSRSRTLSAARCHLLVDRRHRLLGEALDLVHRAARSRIGNGYTGAAE